LGTLAQVQEGLWNALERWFNSFLVIRESGDEWWVPPIFPGGYTIGFLLLLNLIAAHIKRFQWTSKKIGINLTHLGIIIMLVGGLASSELQEESHLSFREGETKSYSEAHRSNELAVITDSATAGQEEVVAFPESMVAAKQEISHEKVPFTIRVKEYVINGEITSQSAVLDAASKLTTAFATVDAQFATAEGLASQAQQAQESAGRLEVWRAALKAVGETDVQDVVAAAKRVAAQPEREARLREELKARFKNEMLRMFSREAGPMQDPEQVTAMRYAADKLGKGEQITAESLKPVGDQGSAQSAVIMPLKEAKDMERRNMPYAIVELAKGGQTLGTWLVSPMLTPQKVTVDGKEHRLAFRFKRHYYPFAVTLLKTTHETYRGTVTDSNPNGIPKNFQSRVRIDNPQTGEKREVDIYMNHPLRYAGMAFFQYQMGRDEQRALGTSTLQVVKNPSWLAPYIGTIVVSVGMTWQFLFHLLRFNKKRSAPEPTPRPAPREKRKDRAAAAASR
ncbi:MAG: cytochrome c biogenesis protein ResB, partial [Chthoniobacteraceae bacterium]